MLTHFAAPAQADGKGDSYHLASLYSPVFTLGWEKWVPKRTTQRAGRWIEETRVSTDWRIGIAEDTKTRGRSCKDLDW